MAKGVESKTAKASRVGDKATKFVKLCYCGKKMEAVKKLTETGHSRGMFWQCEDEHELKVR